MVAVLLGLTQESFVDLDEKNKQELKDRVIGKAFEERVRRFYVTNSIVHTSGREGIQSHYKGISNGAELFDRTIKWRFSSCRRKNQR